MSKPTEKPIKNYQISVTRHLIKTIILMLIAILFFIWWLDIEHIKDIMIALIFCALLISGSWFYAWKTKEKTAIHIYKQGLYLDQQFLPWNQIKSIYLKQTDIDTISYHLVVCKKDGTTIDSKLDFMDVKSDEIFQHIKSEFNLYQKNNPDKNH